MRFRDRVYLAKSQPGRTFGRTSLRLAYWFIEIPESARLLAARNLWKYTSQFFFGAGT
jgi:hypothetical protein